jgi:hypothetical protein
VRHTFVFILLLTLALSLFGCASLREAGFYRSTVRVDEIDPGDDAIAGETIPDQTPDTKAVGLDPAPQPVPAPDEPEANDVTAQTAGQEESDPAADPEKQRRGEPFVAPIPFRSPSLGWGGSLAGGYIFRLDPKDEKSPPSTIGGGAFGTENESYGGVVSMRGHAFEDRWRFLLMAFVARIEYEFFGIGSDAGEHGQSIDLRSDTYTVKFDLLRQLPTANLGRFGRRLYLGPVFESRISKTDPTSSGGLPAGIQSVDLDEDQFAMGAKVLRDTRDNNFFPLAGSLAEVSIHAFDEALGGDNDYRLIDVSLRSYQSIRPETVVAARIFGKFGEGDVPFTALPQHDLRGYERGRYRDKVHVAGELEIRQEIWGRIGGAAFAGLGQIAPRIDDLDSDTILWSAGFGLRFQLTEENRMNYRSDIAWGRNGFEFYFSISEAF